MFAPPWEKSVLSKVQGYIIRDYYNVFVILTYKTSKKGAVHIPHIYCDDNQQLSAIISIFKHSPI